MDKIKEKFLSIQDTRHQSYMEHKLSDILVITMCAVLCGIDSLNGIISYAENKKEFLKNKFGITKIPFKLTLSCVLNMVDAGSVAGIITDIMKESIERGYRKCCCCGWESYTEYSRKREITSCIADFNCILYRKQRCTRTGSHI